MATPARIIQLLGGPRVLGESPSTNTDFISLVRRGVPYGSLRETTAALHLTMRELTDALHLKGRTLARRRHGSRLTPTESERVLRLARVAARAESVFQDRARAHTWLRRPNRSLGGAVPLELLDTDLGGDSVLDVLYRIEDGVFS